MCTISVLNDPKYDIYVLCYDNIQREENMIRRFNEVGTKVNICRFTENDKRYNMLVDANYPYPNGCFLNHLAMMEEFYNNSSKEFGIFLENDVFLKKTLTKDLHNACSKMKQLDLDVLLIGYLINNTPEAFGCQLIDKDDFNNGYYKYNDELWGTQGFILTRAQVKYYIDKYTVEYIIDPNTKETISADWVYTKNGNRALLYPPLVVEEGTINGTHEGQIQFHKTCKEFLHNDTFTS
jgi:GR25 family glycosyltransferase involved in LPS biosynthesis